MDEITAYIDKCVDEKYREALIQMIYEYNLSEYEQGRADGARFGD